MPESRLQPFVSVPRIFFMDTLLFDRIMNPFQRPMQALRQALSARLDAVLGTNLGASLSGSSDNGSSSMPRALLGAAVKRDASPDAGKRKSHRSHGRKHGRNHGHSGGRDDDAKGYSRDELPHTYLPQTHTSWWEIVRANGMSLIHVPPQQRTEVLCDVAMSRNPLAFQYVPHEYRNEERSALAVHAKGDLLHLVPRSTRAVRMLAVQQNPWMVLEMDELDRDDMLWAAALLREGMLWHHLRPADFLRLDSWMASLTFAQVEVMVKEEMRAQVSPLLERVQEHFRQYVGTTPAISGGAYLQ